GKPRELHIDPCLASIDFSDFEPSLGKPVNEVIVSCDHFHVERWSLTEPRPAHNQRQFSVFQCVSGRVEFADRHFKPGDLFLVTAEGYREAIKPLDPNTTVLRTTIEKN
ncbi:MAG TPA: mannose-6-phosphate isomerase, partial [Chthoniobacterales bacterium]|nr:mannose-6-phosphate isomerase [Chthoniobacterales bacterium]